MYESLSHDKLNGFWWAPCIIERYVAFFKSSLSIMYVYVMFIVALGLQTPSLVLVVSITSCTIIIKLLSDDLIIIAVSTITIRRFACIKCH